MADQPTLIYRIQQELKRRDPGPPVNRLMLEALIELLAAEGG